MKSLLIAPHNLFQLIETAVTENPALLKSNEWHELPNGREAFTEEQIMDEDTAHDIAGWVVFFTPDAARFERIRLDVDDYANEILVNSGRKPIPLGIIHSGETESSLNVIKRRAAVERSNQRFLTELFN